MSYTSPGQPSSRWQEFVERSPILSLAVVGVIATQLGTYFGYVFPAVGLPTLPWPLYNGLLGIGVQEGEFGVFSNFEAYAADPQMSFFVGQALHFINGIVFVLLWGVLFREDVAKFVKNNIASGLLYGVIMTIISAELLVPYAYVQNNGYGFFLFDGPDGWKLPFGILIWHLIYGLFLGLLWNPSRRDTAET